ncbi:hypothetical protein CcaverHIS002_0207080 [Cutaneotrichosporon cavernicola]|nr:hypothetical protein CcaverHIS002_0207080 [Cutaneotrichosporon cavernicola]
MLATRPRFSITSYPRYVGASQAFSPLVPHRNLLPLRQHPASSPAPPEHPPRPPLPPTPPAFERSLHASPAAWPKTLAEGSGKLSRDDHPFRYKPVTAKESKEERNMRIADEKDACMRLRLAADHWSLEEGMAGGQDGQWLAAERWRRRDRIPGGLTLVLTHANGLQKEHWIPMMADLLAREPGTAGSEFGTGAALKGTNVAVNDVWMLDDTHHAASVDLNAGRLGPAHSWSDTARDVINFIEHVLPAVQAAEGEAPWQLAWNDKTAGRTAPQVVGIGHSYGASALVQAANSRPELFSSLFLVEPMCVPLMVNFPDKGYPLTAGALKRRSHWPSREDAAAVRTNPLFKTWDEGVFKTWLSHSLAPSDPAQPDGAVELATPTWAEAAVFSDPHSTLRGWDQLPNLEMPTGFLMAGDEVWMAGEKLAGEMVWRSKRARNERIMDATHLLVQEKPVEAAASLWRFLTTLDAERLSLPCIYARKRRRTRAALEADAEASSPSRPGRQAATPSTPSLLASGHVTVTYLDPRIASRAVTPEERVRLTTPPIRDDDPVTFGLLSLPEAEELSSMFMRQLNPLISLLDPTLHTLGYMRATSPALLSAVLMCAAQFFRRDLYPSLRAHARSLTDRATSTGEVSVGTVQALMLMLAWKEPTDGTGGIKLAVAVRMGYQLGLHHPAPLPADEDRAREIADGTRTWFTVAAFDRINSDVFGLPGMVPVSELPDFDAHLHRWFPEDPRQGRFSADEQAILKWFDLNHLLRIKFLMLDTEKIAAIGYLGYMQDTSVTHLSTFGVVGHKDEFLRQTQPPGDFDAPSLDDEFWNMLFPNPGISV